MDWLVEPLKGMQLLTEIEPAGSCTGGATLNHCGCIAGLIQCDCSGDMKYAK